MRYVFINPVTAQMYPRAELDAQLARAGYRRVECDTVWRDVVLARYRELTRAQPATIADARCPLAVELVKAHAPSNVRIAPIEPILLCCGRELSARPELSDGDKLITAPCRALAAAGNALCLPRTRFAPWREFAREAHIDIVPRALSECPIPPGFFAGLGCAAASATGRAEILRLLADLPNRDLRIIELLYCPGGCHNGDGIWPDDGRADGSTTQAR